MYCNVVVRAYKYYIGYDVVTAPAEPLYMVSLAQIMSIFISWIPKADLAYALI